MTVKKRVVTVAKNGLQEVLTPSILHLLPKIPSPPIPPIGFLKKEPPSTTEMPEFPNPPIRRLFADDGNVRIADPVVYA